MDGVERSVRQMLTMFVQNGFDILSFEETAPGVVQVEYGSQEDPTPTSSFRLTYERLTQP
jgi:hypothetical protein